MEVKRTATLEFEIIEKIGEDEGRNSKVFLAKDTQLDAMLVVKEISKASLRNLDIAIENYYDECKALYASRSPYVVEVQYACEDKENIYLSMPYLQAGSLSKKMDNQYLTVREIIKYSIDILNALAVVHSKNLVHLDIKPTNVLIDDSGRGKLTDFGLSKILDNNGLTEQGYGYTLHMEPEVFKTDKRSVYSDIYQFGVTLYRMCNGNDILEKQQKMFNMYSSESCMKYIMSGKFPIREYYLPHINKKLQKIVKKCLMVEPCKRYNNVIEIINDISLITEGLDWRYCPEEEYIYQKRYNSDKLKCIKVEKKDSKFNVICIKSDLDGKNTRKINKYCIKNLLDYESLNKQLAYIIEDDN